MVRGGNLLRREMLTGRADGRYRLGGAQNLHPTRSLFDAAVMAGDGGVEWTDGPRARGGAGRGSASEAVLLRAADSADQLPAAVVVGSDRAIDELSLVARLNPWGIAGASDAREAGRSWM